jgi:hypothetical protein
VCVCVCVAVVVVVGGGGGVAGWRVGRRLNVLGTSSK